MKFILIDKLEKLEPGKLAIATKQLSLAEEYLGDHFPTFPVLPGVLMLEAMVQTASWVVRTAQDYANSVIVLEEARNVSYGTFVAPGDRMTVTAEAIKIDDKTSTFKTNCTVDGQSSAKARLTLKHYNMAERHVGRENEDKKLIEEMKIRFKLLSGPKALKK